MKSPKRIRLNSEILYKKLLDHMNEGVWMGDKYERTLYANPKFCKMMGYTLEEMLGRKSYDFWDKESAERVKKINLHHRKKGISSSYEGILVSKEGQKIPVLLSGTPLLDGGTVGIITDLTELKKKEEQEKILGSAMEYATDAIIVFNEKGIIQSWNKGAKIIFGYKKDEIIGKSFNTIFPKEQINRLFHNIVELSYFELQGLHSNKSQLHIAATFTVLFQKESQKEPIYLLIGRDITTQAKFEEELALKYQKMKEAYNKFGILRRQMDYIFDILDFSSAEHDKKSIADFIVNSIIMLTRVDGCVLRFYNAKKKRLELASCFGVSPEWQGKASIPLKNSLVEKALDQKRPLKIIDVTKEPRYRSISLAKKNNLCSLLLIPLQFRSQLIGSLSLYTTPQKKLEIFENEFIEKYTKLVEIIVWMMIKE